MSIIVKRVGAVFAAVVAAVAMLVVALPAQAANDAWSVLSDTEKKSSYGYFVWKSVNAGTQEERAAAAKAADILKNAPKKSYTNIGAETDATSLENFKAAVEETARINDFRSAQADEPCRTDLPAGKGRACDDASKRLQPLVMTDILMAIAQSNVNYSRLSANHHAQQYNVGENLHWAAYLTYFDQLAQWYGEDWKNCKTGQSVAACGWYWTEKPLYDADPNDPGAGHYDNLTNKSDDYTYTGVAINSNSDYGYAVSQVYSYPELDAWNDMTAPTYAASDYLADVNAYVSSFKTIAAVTNPKDVTVESGTVKPTDKLPKTVAVTYDDKSTGTAAVTWNIPDNWNADRAQHTLTVTGTVEGTSKTASLKLTVKAATVTSVAADGNTTVTTASGTAPTLPGTATVSWSNGSTEAAKIAWDANDGYKNPNGGTYTVTGKVGNTGKTVTATVTVTAATVVKVANPADATVVKGGTIAAPTAKVTWSNGSVTDEAIVWDAGQDPTKTTFDTLGDRTFTGTAAGQKITWKVTVVDATVTKAYDPAPFSVESGVDPTAKLPTTVKADLSNGKTQQDVPVVWAGMNDTWKHRQGGTITLTGTVNGQADKTVKLVVTVKPATIKSVAVDPATLSTPAGVDPARSLPAKATVTWSNGEVQNDVAVAWDAIKAANYATAGKTFAVAGTVSVDGQSGKATVRITVTDPVALSATATRASVDVVAGHAPDLGAVKANITYSDGSVKTADVDWPADVDVSKPGDVKVNGTVRGVTDANGKALPVTLTVKVAARAITAVTPTADTIAIDTARDDASLPPVIGKAIVTWNDGATEERELTLTLPDGWNKPHTAHYVTATGRTDGWSKDVEFTVKVNAATVFEVQNPADFSTVEGVVPALPATANVTWSNGQTTAEKIVWDVPDNFDSLFDKASDTPVVVAGEVQGLVVMVGIRIEKATIQSVTAPDTVTVDAGQTPTLPAAVTAKLSNGKEIQVSVAWENGVDFSNRSGKDKTVTVKGEINGYPAGVTATVVVRSAVVTSATLEGAPVSVTVESGKDPVATGKLPKTAKATWSDGGEDTVELVTWDAKFDGYKARKGGVFTITGDVRGKAVSATVNVKPATPVGLQDRRVDVAVTVGNKLTLPQTAKVVWSNGDVTDETVTWGSYDAALLNKETKFAVSGKVAVPADASGNADTVVTYDITATVTVRAKGSEEQQKPDQSKTNPVQKTVNGLSNTGADVALIAIAVVVIAVVAVAALVVAKRKRG